MPDDTSPVPAKRRFRRRPSRTRSERLLRIAGVDPQALVSGPAAEQPLISDLTRYSVMGFAVCVTALFAAAALPVALTLATGGFNVLFLVYGLLWGLFVFNLDRWVVSSVDYHIPNAEIPRLQVKAVSVLRTAGLFVVRLVVAVLIGLSISEPLVILVYGHEIGVWLEDRKPGRRADITREVMSAPEFSASYAVEAGRLEDAKKETAAAAEGVRVANEALDAEQSGAGGTRTRGLGNRTTERRTDLKNAQTRLDNANTAEAAAQTAYDQARLKPEQARDAELTRRLAEVDAKPGLLDRERALSSLAAEEPAISTAQWVLRGLILLVDLAPVLLKMASPKTVYERNLRRRVAADIEDHDRLLAERTMKTRSESELRLEIDEQSRREEAAHHELVLGQHYRVEAERLVRESDLDIRRAIHRHRQQIEDDGLAGFEDAGLLPTPDRRLSGAMRADSNQGPETDPGQSASPSRTSIGDDGGFTQLVDQRWRLGRQIADGERGRSLRAPYLARDVYDKTDPPLTFVVKCVELPGRQDDVRAAMRELTSLPHGKEISPYVTRVVHGGFDPQFGYFVVTPYYANGTLQQLINDPSRSLSLGRALTITEQLLRGLQAAFDYEERCLVHFDIKPSNVAFDEHGNVRIIDWGLSEVSAADYEISLDGSHGYTLWYAPAEQVNAKPGGGMNWISPRCDIRAVGAVCYAMITGRPPLHLEARWLDLLDDSGALRENRREDFTRLLTFVAPLPLTEFFAANSDWDDTRLDGLSHLLEQWLSPDPADRVGTGLLSAHEFALDALTEVLHTLRNQAADLLDRKVGAEAVPLFPKMRPMDLEAYSMSEGRRDDQTVIPFEASS